MMAKSVEGLRRIAQERLREIEQLKLALELANAQIKALSVVDGRCGSCEQEVFEQ